MAEHLLAYGRIDLTGLLDTADSDTADNDTCADSERADATSGVDAGCAGAGADADVAMTLSGKVNLGAGATGGKSGAVVMQYEPRR